VGTTLFSESWIFMMNWSPTIALTYALWAGEATLAAMVVLLVGLVSVCMVFGVLGALMQGAVDESGEG
jgi:hypothetical protein